MKKPIIPFVLCAAAVCALSGCSQTVTKQRSYFNMYVYAVASVSGDYSRGNGAETVLDEIGGVLNAVEDSVKTYTAAFNSAEAGERVTVDETFYGLLSRAKEIYGETDGAYNPAVYYSVEAYGFFRGYNSEVEKPATLPDDETVAKFVELSQSFAEISLSSDGGYSVVKPAKTVEVDGTTLSLKIDLGGIAKGYAVDEVAKIYSTHGVKYGYFDFGQSSTYCLKHHSRGSYRYSFINPRDTGNTYLSTDVENSSVTTSGDYMSYYEVEGVRYCHIIDPFTGKPVGVGSDKNISSATIIGGSACEADAYATAITSMTLDGAKEFIKRKLSDRRVFFTVNGADGMTVYTNRTGGFTTHFKVEYVP